MRRRTTVAKRRSTRRRSTIIQRRASRTLRRFSLIEGVMQIVLSPLTQKFVECDIGNKITPVNPWIYVDKEKIETHLEFYQTDSCFYPIKTHIEAFPKNEILIGCFVCAVNISATFFICTTLSAEEAVLHLLEQQRINIQERIRKMQIREPGDPWDSLGSEIEIEADMNLNNRNLYVVEVHAISLVKQKNKFVMRFVEDLRDGYIEMLPGRNTYNAVIKKRIHKGVQCASTFEDKGVQSSFGGYFTKSVQCSYEYEEIKLTDKLAISLKNFLQVTCSYVCSKLNENIELNMEVNDYQCLPNYASIKILLQPVEIKVYQEISHCIGKKISCLSWNAFTSGIVATAYATYPLFLVIKGPPFQTNNVSSEEENFALIWEYKNNVIPKLYLHGRQEITAMSFCPYNKYILVTGYTSGQIAIWDLTESLQISKPPRYRTISEQQNHMQIVALTSWIKKPFGHKHIFPVITSKVDVSHSSPVTSITWIPPDSFTSADDEPTTKEYVLKFATSELNGNVIYIWELDPNKEVIEVYHAFKSRVNEKLEALNRGVSKLKKYQARFAPSSKLYVSSLVSPKNYPMMKILPRNELYTYKTNNPSTLKDLYEETNFSVTGLKHPFDSSEKLLFSTGLGVLQLASCVGPHTSTGESIEICKIETLAVVHDGPILVCETNGFFPNVILTVGGSVFAIWDLTLRVVLLWRKSCLRYLSGMWCFHRPLSLIMMRNDRHFEYWNVCDTSRNPLKIFKYKGYGPINFHADMSRFHIRKNTFIATDSAGAFKLLLLPSETAEQKDYNISEAKAFMKRMVNLINYKEALKMNYNKIHDDVVDFVVEEEEPLENKDDFTTAYTEGLHKTSFLQVRPTRAEIFQKKQEKHGISVLLNLKGLSMDRLEQIKMPITDTFQPEDVIIEQLNKKQDQKARTVQQTKNRILEAHPKTYNSLGKLKPTIAKDLANEMKNKFLEDYKNVEEHFKSTLKTVSLKHVVQKMCIHGDKVETRRKKDRRSSSKSSKNQKKSVEFKESITEIESLHTIFTNQPENDSVSYISMEGNM